MTGNREAPRVMDSQSVIFINFFQSDEYSGGACLVGFLLRPSAGWLLASPGLKE